MSENGATAVRPWLSAMAWPAIAAVVAGGIAWGSNTSRIDGLASRVVGHDAQLASIQATLWATASRLTTIEERLASGSRENLLQNEELNARTRTRDEQYTDLAERLKSLEEVRIKTLPLLAVQAERLEAITARLQAIERLLQQRLPQNEPDRPGSRGQ